MIEISRTCDQLWVVSSEKATKLYLNGEYVANLKDYDMKTLPITHKSYMWAIWENGYKYSIIPDIDSYYCTTKDHPLNHETSSIYSADDLISGVLAMLIAILIITVWYGI
jgi:hypothetical protein